MVMARQRRGDTLRCHGLERVYSDLQLRLSRARGFIARARIYRWDSFWRRTDGRTVARAISRNPPFSGREASRERVYVLCLRSSSRGASVNRESPRNFPRVISLQFTPDTSAASVFLGEEKRRRAAKKFRVESGQHGAISNY